MKDRIKNLIYGIEVTSAYYIQNLVDSKLGNEDKKKELDRQVIEYVNGFPMNPILKAIIRPFIPCITQSIYNLIKRKISGVTKE